MKKTLSAIFLMMIMFLVTTCGNSSSSNVTPPAEPKQESSSASTVAEKKSDTVPDVPEKHWARNEVLYLVKKEIMLPYGDGTFKGDRNITNYEFALALAKILDDTYKGTVPSGSAHPFTDVPAGHWAYDSVCKLAAMGITEGYGDRTFRGDRNVTRYYAAHEVANLLVKVAPNSVPSNISCPYSDIPEKHWARDAVSILTNKKIDDEGYGDGTFRGDRDITRYEVAIWLAKLHSFLKKSA